MDEPLPFPGQLEGILDPRQHDILIGHHEQRHALTNAFEKDRFPQAWLLQGPAGVGKATFAWHFARRLVERSDVNAQDLPNEILDKYARGSQSKILDISLSHDDKGKLKTQISVDQIRSLSEKLAMASVEGEWRVVIVDPAEAMNNAAANALLKLLEEPPKRVVFFLITQAPHRILPTIHSRCQKIRFHELSTDELSQIWPLVSELDLGSAERLALAEGSMRMAFEMNDEMSEYYLKMVNLVARGAPEEDISRLAQSLNKSSRVETLDRAKLLFHLLFGRLSRIASGLVHAPEQETKAAQSIQNKLPQWAELSQIVLSNLDDAQRLNLDAEVSIVTQWLAIQTLLRHS